MVGGASSSHPSPPEAIRGKCRPRRRLSVLLSDPYLLDPPDEGFGAEATGATLLERPERAYRAATGVVEGDAGTGRRFARGVLAAGVMSFAGRFTTLTGVDCALASFTAAGGVKRSLKGDGFVVAFGALQDVVGVNGSVVKVDLTGVLLGVASLTAVSAAAVTGVF